MKNLTKIQDEVVNPLRDPLNHSLEVLLNEIKRGRPAETQLQIQKWIDELTQEKLLGKTISKEAADKDSFEDVTKYKIERSYSEIEVELIAYEMVNWAIDNIGNVSVQSGKKFDEVIAKFKSK